jgi:hypothetical protein
MCSLTKIIKKNLSGLTPTTSKRSVLGSCIPTIMVVIKNKNMDRLKTTLYILILIFAFTSCKIVKSLSQLHKKEAKIYSYELENKEIKFCPMHHLGKKEFFDDVANKVHEYKQNGYIVFYELISTDFTSDSLLRDTIRRKVRKIKGFSGTYKDNADSSSLFKKYIQQPNYKDLGIDDNDIRADVNYLQLINQWEKLNGKILLDSLDINTPFDAKFQKGVFYNNQQYTNIIIDYRNDNLIALLKASKQDKILIIYGSGHRQNLKRKLKK